MKFFSKNLHFQKSSNIFVTLSCKMISSDLGGPQALLIDLELYPTWKRTNGMLCDEFYLAQECITNPVSELNN